MWGEGAGGRGLKMLNAKFQKEIFYAKLLQISGAFQVLYSKKQIVFPWRASERLTAHPRFPGRNLQSDRPLVDLKE